MKTANHKPGTYPTLGERDAGNMHARLRSCVSGASPRGLRVTGRVQTVIASKLWRCETEDLITGEARGTRWLTWNGTRFDVAKVDPREAA